MTDRELLEWAAKAEGLTGYIHEWINGPEFIVPGLNPVTWNPLTDDGDALRLAVKLGLVVHVWLHEEGVSVAQSLEHGNAPKDDASDLWFFECVHSNGGDANKATRRAIVRAAAEIGKAMP